MGTCCNGRKNADGEDNLRTVINEITLPSYFQLKKLLNSNCVEKSGRISNKKLIKEIFPKFYEEESAHAKYLHKLFLYIGTMLDDNDNIYVVLFYLLPFINFTTNDEESEAFFEVLEQLNRRPITVTDLTKPLTTYYTFITKQVTNCYLSEFFKEVEDKSQHDQQRQNYEDLHNLLTQIYTDKNCKNEAKKKIKIFKANYNMDDSHQISVSYFKEYFKHLSFCVIRDNFIYSYSSN
jgi:hypothetical protein